MHYNISVKGKLNRFRFQHFVSRQVFYAQNMMRRPCLTIFFRTEQAITVASLIVKCSFEMRVFKLKRTRKQGLFSRKAKDFLESKVKKLLHERVRSTLLNGGSRKIEISPKGRIKII